MRIKVSFQDTIMLDQPRIYAKLDPDCIQFPSKGFGFLRKYPIMNIDYKNGPWNWRISGEGGRTFP